MRYKTTTIGCVLVVIAHFWASNAWADDDSKLEGKWRIVQLTQQGKAMPIPANTAMVMTFQVTGHRWQLVAQTRGNEVTEHGTWTLRGDRLTTKTDDALKIENIRVKFKGTILEFLKDDGSLTLEKVR